MKYTHTHLSQQHVIIIIIHWRWFPSNLYRFDCFARHFMHLPNRIRTTYFERTSKFPISHSNRVRCSIIKLTWEVNSISYFTFSVFLGADCRCWWELTKCRMCGCHDPSQAYIGKQSLRATEFPCRIYWYVRTARWAIYNEMRIDFAFFRECEQLSGVGYLVCFFQSIFFSGQEIKVNPAVMYFWFESKTDT